MDGISRELRPNSLPRIREAVFVGEIADFISNREQFKGYEEGIQSGRLKCRREEQIKTEEGGNGKNTKNRVF